MASRGQDGARSVLDGLAPIPELLPSLFGAATWDDVPGFPEAVARAGERLSALATKFGPEGALKAAARAMAAQSMYVAIVKALVNGS